MNKGSQVRYIGTEFNQKGFCGFTPNKIYPVLAGLGDGVPRNDGKLGAFIQEPGVFVVEDESKSLRRQQLGANWELVEQAESVYAPKPDYKSPIQTTTSFC